MNKLYIVFEHDNVVSKLVGEIIDAQEKQKCPNDRPW